MKQAKIIPSAWGLFERMSTAPVYFLLTLSGKA